jgi:bacterioferritin
MKGDAAILKHLNGILRNELTAINQYFLHARMCKNWGLKRLGEHEYKESMEEMKHADRLVERILFLDGLPNLQDLNKLRIGENAEEVLKCDFALEMEALPMLKAAIGDCEKKQDYVTRDLLRQILHDEENAVDFLEIQLGLIEQMGLQNYIQSLAGEVAEGGQ